MRFTKEQLSDHPKFGSLLGLVNSKKPKESTENEGVIEKKSVESEEAPSTVYKNNAYCFVVPGLPMGKPRMTQRDRWMKRGCVVRYREYCDRIRAAAGTSPVNAYSIAVIAFLPMPASWSEKKKTQLEGQIAQQKPDWDNIAKAICDALFDDDSIIGGGTCWKFWCRQGEEKTLVTVLTCGE